MQFNHEEVQQILPHRKPMLLITEVAEVVPGESITASFDVDPEMEIFRGHFLGDPVLPGVYSVECMAQATDILLMTQAKYAGKVPLLLGVNQVRFFRKICPGSRLEIRAQLKSERVEKAIATCDAQVFCQGELMAYGEISITMR